MEFESKILSKNISELLYNSEKTLVRLRVALAVESLRQSSLCRVLPTTSRVVSYLIPTK